jgi:hypothetical protein
LFREPDVAEVLQRFIVIVVEVVGIARNRELLVAPLSAAEDGDEEHRVL